MSKLKTMSPMACALLLSLSTVACSESAKVPVATGDNMGGMKMDHMSMGNVQQHTVVAHGVGIVKAIDLKTKSITIAHGPIAEVRWSGMTMAFPVADAKLLAGIKVGTKVAFTFHSAGIASNSITELVVK